MVLFWYMGKLFAYFVFNSFFSATHLRLAFFRYGMMICLGIYIIMLLISKIQSFTNPGLSSLPGPYSYEFAFAASPFYHLLSGQVKEASPTFFQKAYLPPQSYDGLFSLAFMIKVSIVLFVFLGLILSMNAIVA